MIFILLFQSPCCTLLPNSYINLVLTVCPVPEKTNAGLCPLGEMRFKGYEFWSPNLAGATPEVGYTIK